MKGSTMLQTFRETFPDGTPRRDIAETRITSDGRTRPLRSLRDLRELYELTSDSSYDPTQFDYVDDDEDARFVRAYGSMWDTVDCERAPDSYRRHGWDGVATTSLYTATLFRYFDADGDPLDGVMVGWANRA